MKQISLPWCNLHFTWEAEDGCTRTRIPDIQGTCEHKGERGKGLRTVSSDLPLGCCSPLLYHTGPLLSLVTCVLVTHIASHSLSSFSTQHLLWLWALRTAAGRVSCPWIWELGSHSSCTGECFAHFHCPAPVWDPWCGKLHKHGCPEMGVQERSCWLHLKWLLDSEQGKRASFSVLPNFECVTATNWLSSF